MTLLCLWEEAGTRVPPSTLLLGHREPLLPHPHYLWEEVLFCSICSTVEAWSPKSWPGGSQGPLALDFQLQTSPGGLQGC